MLDPTTITYVATLSGITSSTISTSTPLTVVGIYISQENLASNAFIECVKNDNTTSTEIMRNWARSTEYVHMNSVCLAGNYLRFRKSGMDNAQTILNYVTYDRHTFPNADGNSYATIALLLVIAGILLFDMFRRIFANR